MTCWIVNKFKFSFHICINALHAINRRLFRIKRFETENKAIEKQVRHIFSLSLHLQSHFIILKFKPFLLSFKFYARAAIICLAEYIYFLSILLAEQKKSVRVFRCMIKMKLIFFLYLNVLLTLVFWLSCCH